MLRTTLIHDYHARHAKMTEFAGYDMPLWYTTIKDEHLAVRNSSGVFDVSHMGRFEISGEGSTRFLEGLLPTQVERQSTGRAFYSLLLNERAGIVDDLIVTRLGQSRYMIIVNAANAGTDMRHLLRHAPSSGVQIDDLTASSVMIAVQGPESARSLQPLTGLDLKQLKRFRCAETDLLGQASIVSRRGYTGEDGYEVIVSVPTKDPTQPLKIWETLATTSTPCGLGARDSLRLEAGLPLYGSDIDQGTNPFEADLSWVITPNKAGYVGSEKISELAGSPPTTVRKGLLLDHGIPRHGFEIHDQSGPAGLVTSGTFSPILQKGIALCKIQRRASEPGSQVEVQVRDESQPAQVVKPPFYDERVYGWKRLSKGN